MIQIARTRCRMIALTAGLLSTAFCQAETTAGEVPQDPPANAILLVGYTTETGPGDSSPEAGNAATSTSPTFELRKAMENLGFEPDSSVLELALADFASSVETIVKKHPLTGLHAFASLYLSCMASTSTASSRIAFRIPADSEAVFMEKWDSSTREAWSVLFQKAAGDKAGNGSWQPAYAFSKSPATEQLLGLEVSEINFEVRDDSVDQGTEPATEMAAQPAIDPAAKTGTESTPGAGFLAAEVQSPDFDSIAVRVDVKQQGSAWAASEFAGSEIIRSFHQAYTARIPPSTAETTFWSGQLAESVGLLQHGLPLKIHRQTQSSIGGTLMSSRMTESVVSRIQLLAADESKCTESIIPDGYQVSHTLVAPEVIAESLGRSGEQQ